VRKIFYILTVYIFSSCASHKEEGVAISDATLFNLLQNTSSFTYFRNNSDTLATDPSSEHGTFMRVRFNPKAISAMDDSVKSLNEAIFPDESMIVKEVYYQRGGPLIEYVVMYKLRNAANSSYSWVWSEMNPSGEVIYSSARKGDRCLSCHLTSSNSDLVRTFSLH
jgi:hypothetical protein